MDKLRIAVVGYGNIGKYTVQALQAAPDMEIAGIVRRSGDADKPAELAPYKVVKDITELGKVDVAILATPTRSVEEHAVKCLKLGINTVDRPLSEFGSFFIRANDSIPIIKKVLSKASSFMNESVSAIDTFGIPSKEKGHKDRRPGDVKLLHTVGYNDQGNSYIEMAKVKKNQHLIDKYKVKISIMVPQGGEVGIKPENGYRSISTPQIVPPGMVDTFSYLNIGFFDTEEEAKNLVSFISTKFARYLLRTTYSSVHVSKDNFCFVPAMDMKKKWTDEELFDHFELNDEERKLINKTMRPMDLAGG